MPVIAMKVESAEKHPNADALRLYSMEAPGYERVPIVANLENVYEVGDTVAIALPDSLLKDGTKIKPAKIRGIQSFGMALGKVDESVGTDLSEAYCQKQVEQSVQFQKWPSIELLHNVRRSLEQLGETPKVTYRAKIKLDGTNGGVQIFSDRRVAVQSRTQIITPQGDNAGFAGWVSQNIDYFANLAIAEHITLFGEWCGKGIQKRTAISQIDRRIFVIFAIQFGGTEGKIAKLEIRPEQIRQFLPEHPDIFILPFYGEAIAIDFGNTDQLKESAATLNQIIEDVEKSDPWVQENFGIAGLGEGLVMYPEADGLVERLAYSELLFKVKGEKHQVVKIKQPVQIDPETANSIEEFVNLFLTPARLEQAATETCNGDFDIKKIGDFLKWIAIDIQKESSAELESSNLSWRQVSKAISKEAKQWYQQKAIS